MTVEFAGGALGLPYHGLVEDGELELPNNETIAYPQPAAGGTFIVRRPGWAASERSPEEADDDAEKGRVWRDYAIINGYLRTTPPLWDLTGPSRKMDLGGKEINGWIWFDQDGAAWLVRIGSWGTAFVQNTWMNLTFRRFGLFGADPPESFELTTPAFNLQQDTEEEFRFNPESGSAILQTNDSRIHHKLLDIKNDGSAALFSAFIQHRIAGETAERPVAIYEVEIASDGSEAIGRVLAGRMDCLGDLAHSEPTPPAQTIHQLEITAELFRFPRSGGSCNLGDFWEDEQGVESAGSTTVVSTRSSATPGLGFYERAGTSGQTVGFGHITTPDQHWHYKTVIGAWYKDGRAEIVRFVIEVDATFTGTSSAQPSGARVQKCENGVRTIDDDRQVVLSSQHESERVQRIYLLAGTTRFFENTIIRREDSSVSGRFYVESESDRYELTASTSSYTSVNGRVVQQSGLDGVEDTGLLFFAGQGFILGPPTIGVGIPITSLQYIIDRVPWEYPGGSLSYAEWAASVFSGVRITDDGLLHRAYVSGKSRGDGVPLDKTLSGHRNLRPRISGAWQPEEKEWAGDAALSDSLPDRAFV